MAGAGLRARAGRQEARIMKINTHKQREETQEEGETRREDTTKLSHNVRETNT